MRVLIADTDRDLLLKLNEELKKSDIEISNCYDGTEAVENIENQPYDLVILDSDLPNLDGISALKEIKRITNIPVFITSNRKEEFDVIYAYEAGCNDYIRKPYFIKEVVMKIKNYFYKGSPKTIKFEGLEVDYQSHTIIIDGIKKTITNKEFQLLAYLIENNGVAIKREKLLNDVWGYGFFGDDRTIDTHIKMLRNSLGKYKGYIQTIRGFGYIFNSRNG